MTKATVLCVEDEQEFREDIVEFLKSADYDVIEASNGEEGVQQFHNQHPDIVLCDIQMPKMSGLEMLEEIQKKSSRLLNTTPFIFLTAWSEGNHVISGRELGCDDYLVKPVDFMLLSQALESRINKLKCLKQHAQKEAASLRHYMLHILAHSLKTPLHAILSYSDLMDERELLTMQRYKHTIETVMGKYINTINRVSDALALADRNTSLSHLPVHVETILANIAAPNTTPLSKRIPKQLPPITGDENILRELFSDLLEEVQLQSDAGGKVECELNNHSEIEVIFAAKDTRVNCHSGNWVHINTEQPDALPSEFLKLHGVLLMYAKAVTTYHHAQLWLEITQLYNPVYRLVFSIAEETG